MKDIKEFIEKYDWEGLACAFHEDDIKWHAQEWKEFVEEVKETQTSELRKKIEGATPDARPTFIKDKHKTTERINKEKEQGFTIGYDKCKSDILLKL